MSFYRHIAVCNNRDMSQRRPFRVAGHQVGWIDDEMAEAVAAFGDVFVVTADAVTLHPTLDTFEARTRIVAEVLGELQQARNLFDGWRNEPYTVAETFHAPALMHMERAAVPRFGVRGYGVHLNGLVRDGEKLSMWIGERSRTKPNAPGKLDQVVAGGQPATLGIHENLIKECAEEADIPEAMALQARPVGAISYACDRPGQGLRRDVLFVYDLDMPADFVPRNTDGEVEGFHLWPIEQVIEVVRSEDRFKFNCNLVIIDFLIREGLIGPDDAEYEALILGLRQTC